MSLRIKSIWPFLRIFDVGDGSVREELAGFVVSAKAFNLGDSCAAVMLRPSMVMVRAGVYRVEELVGTVDTWTLKGV